MQVAEAPVTCWLNKRECDPAVLLFSFKKQMKKQKGYARTR